MLPDNLSEFGKFSVQSAIHTLVTVTDNLIRCLSYGDQVHMIRHQTISPNRNAEFVLGFSQEAQIFLIIGRAEKNVR